MSNNGYNYGYEQTYYTPQPRSKKSLGRRLSLGQKGKFKQNALSPPHSPSSKKKGAQNGHEGNPNMTRVSMLGEVSDEYDDEQKYSPMEVTPETTGGHRRKLNLGGLRNTIHGSSNKDHSDDRSVFSEGGLRSQFKRGTSFTPRSLKKKANLRGLMTKMKSDRHFDAQEPNDVDFFDDGDDSQGNHSEENTWTFHERSFKPESFRDHEVFKDDDGPPKRQPMKHPPPPPTQSTPPAPSLNHSTHSAGSRKSLKSPGSLKSPRTLKLKKSKSKKMIDDDDQSEVGTVVSKSGRRRKKKKKDAGENNMKQILGSPESPTGSVRSKKKISNAVNSPGSLGSKKKLRSRSKGRRSGVGDDNASVVSGTSRSKRRSGSKPKKPKTKVNAWGEEVEEVSEDETYVHSLYGDDASSSKPRRRRRKKKTNVAEDYDDEEEEMSQQRTVQSKDSAEVEKRRLALEQELESMLDLSNHKIGLEELDTLRELPPPPPMMMDSPVLNNPNRNGSIRSNEGSARSRYSATSMRSSSSKSKPKTEYMPNNNEQVSPQDHHHHDDDDDIQSQEEDRPPIESLTFSQRKQRTFDLKVKEDITEHTHTFANNRTYEYALGESDEEDDRPGLSSSRRSVVSAESSASKKSGSRKNSLRSNSRKNVPDDMSTGAMSAGSLRKNSKFSKKDELNKKMDSMLDQLEKYESNLEEEQNKLRKQLENMTIEKEYLAQRNRQLEFKVEELKDKAAEDADRLLTANRNKSQSSEELEDLKIQNEILKEKLERHEATMLRMNSARSVRGMRSIISQIDDPDALGKQLEEKDKEITKLKADLALMRDQLKYKSEDFDKQAIELQAAREELNEARHTLKHTGTFKYHNRFEEMQQEKMKNKSKQEVLLSSFFDD